MRMEKWRIFPEHQRMDSEKHSTYGSNVSLCSVLMLQDNVCDGFLMSLDKDFSLLFRIKMLYYKLNVFLYSQHKKQFTGFLFIFFQSIIFPYSIVFYLLDHLTREEQQ